MPGKLYPFLTIMFGFALVGLTSLAELLPREALVTRAMREVVPANGSPVAGGSHPRSPAIPEIRTSNASGWPASKTPAALALRTFAPWKENAH